VNYRYLTLAASDFIGPIQGMAKGGEGFIEVGLAKPQEEALGKPPQKGAWLVAKKGGTQRS